MFTLFFSKAIEQHTNIWVRKSFFEESNLIEMKTFNQLNINDSFWSTKNTY